MQKSLHALTDFFTARPDRSILRVGDPENFTPHDYAEPRMQKNALLEYDSQEAASYGDAEDFCSFASWRLRLG